MAMPLMKASSCAHARHKAHSPFLPLHLRTAITLVTSFFSAIALFLLQTLSPEVNWDRGAPCYMRNKETATNTGIELVHSLVHG